MRICFIPIPYCLLILTFCLAGRSDSQEADDRLRAFFESHLEETFQMRPFEATL